MRILFASLTVALLFATTAYAGQPIVKLTEYQDMDDDEREAFVVGVYDGLMVAEQYYKGQDLAWLGDCTAHGTSPEALFEIFDAYLADHPQASLFGVAPAFVYAMANHCDNAPQHMKDLSDSAMLTP